MSSLRPTPCTSQFLDGNKRTGAAVLLAFLEAHSVRVRIPAQTLAAMMIELQRRAESGAAVSGLVDWIAGVVDANRVRPRTRRRKR